MDNSLIFGNILGSILIILVLLGAYASRVKRVGPNQALIVYGRGEPRAGGSTDVRSFTRVVVGGRTFLFPFLEKAAILSLEPARAEFKLDNIITGDGKRISLTGKVQYKVSHGDTSIMKAAQHFLSKTEAERTASVMDGHD